MRDSINYLSLLVFIICFLTANYTEAQSQSQSKSITATAGDNYKATSVSLDWTIGELAVRSYTTQSGGLSEGFHTGSVQSELSTRIQELESVSNFSIYPNPTSGHIRLPATLQSEKFIFSSVFDMSGAFVTIPKAIKDGQIDISSLVAGSYFILLIGPKNNGVVAKIVKI